MSPIRNRASLWAATGVLTAGLAAGGVAQAVSSPSPSPSGGKPSATADAKPDGKGQGKHKGKGHGIAGAAGNVLHGDLVVRTKEGTRTIAVQRGSVVSASPTSIEVRSIDGFTATYAVNADTKVRKGRQAGSLTAGEQVTVVATRSGSTLTATKVLARPAKTEQPQSSE